MNAKVVLSAIVLFVACQCVISADDDCFDMEAYHKDSKEMIEKKKMMETGLKSMCKDDDKDKMIKCIKEKVFALVPLSEMKKEAKKYLKNAAKETEINALLDECYKDKPTFFNCYTEKIIKLCPDSKEVIETTKKEYPDFFKE